MIKSHKALKTETHKPSLITFRCVDKGRTDGTTDEQKTDTNKQNVTQKIKE